VTDGFSKRYGVNRLVWFAMADTMDAAITREKQLKVWKRSWKITLIETDNPTWRDLAEDWDFDPSPPRHPDESQDPEPRALRSMALDPGSSPG